MAQVQKRAKRAKDDGGESLKAKIVEKLDDLSEQSLKEILEFVRYLEARRAGTSRKSAFDAVIGTLPGAALSSEAIDRELYGPVTVTEGADEA